MTLPTSARLHLLRLPAALLACSLALAMAAGCEGDAQVEEVTPAPYNPTGIPDLSFNGTGWVTVNNATTGANRDDIGYAMVLDGSGKILVTGKRSQAGGADPGDMAVWRFTASGALDTSFGTTGVSVYDSGSAMSADAGYAIALDGQGRIVVAGTSSSATEFEEFTVWRINPNAAFDPAFDGDGMLILPNLGGGNGLDIGQGLTVTTDGDLVVNGTGTAGGGNLNGVLLKRNPDGTAETTFAGGQIVIANPGSDAITAVLQDGGYLVAAGWSDDASCTPAPCLTLRRWDFTGNPDATFGGAGIATFQNVDSAPAGLPPFRMRKDGAGNYIVAGTTAPAGAGDDAIVWKIRPNGTPDPSFGGTGYVRLGGAGATNQRAYDVAIDSSGRLVVVGEALGSSGLDLAVWRLLPNGQLDGSFGLGLGYVLLNNAAGGNGADGGYAVRIQDNGRIVVAGYSQSAANGFDLAVWRLQ